VRQWAPDLILRETTEFSSYVVAERRGVPHVQVSIGIASMDDYVLSTVGDALDELGAPRGAAGLEAGPKLLSTPASLDRTAPNEHGDRFRYESTPPSGGLPMGRLDGVPLVYVSFGTVAATMGLFPSLYRAVVAATSKLPIQLIVTVGESGDPSALAPLPDNVHVERFVPQGDVMPYASAVIGHGGFGTTMGALAAGVPAISIPLFSMDQHFNAQAVEAAGAGIALPGGPAATTALPDALERILDDESFGTTAAAIAEELKHLPPTAQAVPLLERAAQTG
jgi:glycosyltransferase